jgi:hypothetical protein
MIFLLCGFGGFFFTQLIKNFSWTQLPHIAKISLAFLGSFGVAGLFFYNNWKSGLAYTIAGAGLAVLIHKLVRCLSLLGDHAIAEIMVLRERRPR